MIIGIDEVGRGCLAGPLVIGAVKLQTPIVGLKDSKLIPSHKRLELVKQIYSLNSEVYLGWTWPHEIDALGLTKATSLAIRRALKNHLYPSDEIIIDGNYNYLKGLKNVKTMIKADNLVPAVSAASIIAKVARDKYMWLMDEYFPHYGFKANVGYGTRIHMDGLNTYGPCALHRQSFAPLNTLGQTETI